MSNLFETLSTATRNQSDLINAGIPSEQATRIAFESSKVALKEVNQDILNEAFKIAFMMGHVYGVSESLGIGNESKEEALKGCIAYVNKLLS